VTDLDNGLGAGESRRPMRRIIFLGPPGAGKGTQAVELARALRVAHLSTGDLLRAAVQAKSPLGGEADGFMRAGALVPDDLVIRLIEERIHSPDAREGFLFDGFPRTIAQADALGHLTPVDRVVYFEIPEAVLTERLTQRRVCPNDGRVYNLATNPPKRPGVCDLDGAALVQRSDDHPEAVKTRLRAYVEKTRPLLEYYRSRGLLRSVDATGTPAGVAARIRAELT
jgi:adenylate kinase